MFSGTDHQRGLGLASADEIIGGRERVNKAGADGLHIERRAALDAGVALARAWLLPEGVVRTLRSQEDDQIADFFRCESFARGERGAQAAWTGRRSEVFFARRRDVALAYAWVRCTIHSSEVSSVCRQAIGIVDDSLLQVAAATKNLRAKCHLQGGRLRFIRQFDDCGLCARHRRAEFCSRKLLDAHIRADADGVRETEIVGAAVAFHRDAFKAEKDRTVVAPRTSIRSRSLASAGLAKR